MNGSVATAFRATSTGYRADLAAHERRLLSTLCADVIQILTARGEDLRPADTAGTVDAAGPAAAPPESAEESTALSAEDSLFGHFRAQLAGLEDEAPLPAPRDEALRRLLPDASVDPHEAGQHRRLSESSLREAKIADLRATRMMLETSPVKVSEDQAPVLGRALNDVRLVLSSRLEIATEQDAEALHARVGSRRRRQEAEPPDGAEAFMAEIYTFITWLQETLFTAMLEFMPEGPHPAADPTAETEDDAGPDENPRTDRE